MIKSEIKFSTLCAFQCQKQNLAFIKQQINGIKHSFIENVQFEPQPNDYILVTVSGNCYYNKDILKQIFKIHKNLPKWNKLSLTDFDFKPDNIQNKKSSQILNGKYAGSKFEKAPPAESLPIPQKWLKR